MRAYARWRSIDRREQWLVVQSATALAVSVIALRVLGIRRLLRIASRTVRVSSFRDHDIGMRLAAMDRAGRYIPGGTCLAKSLALTWILRGRGVPAEVRIGVRKNGALEAHAWVECEGIAVTEPARVADRFVTAY
jgi:hypothetical protein